MATSSQLQTSSANRIPLHPSQNNPANTGEVQNHFHSLAFLILLTAAHKIKSHIDKQTDYREAVNEGSSAGESMLI